MRASARLDRLHRLRVRARERAEREVAAHAAVLDGVERVLADTRAAEDAARAIGGATSGTAIAIAWAHADALARRAVALGDERARAAATAEAAGERMRERRRAEEQLARLAARARLGEEHERRLDGARALDALALWRHGRMR